MLFKLICITYLYLPVTTIIRIHIFVIKLPGILGLAKHHIEIQVDIFNHEKNCITVYSSPFNLYNIMDKGGGRLC